VLVQQPGELHLEHHTPDRTYQLATVTVAEGQAASSPAAGEFEVLRTAPELAAERRQLDRWLAAAPDKVLALVAQMDDPAALPAEAGPVTYACPMHPEVTSDQPGRCPKCGMKLLATQAPVPVTYACPMHPEVTSQEPGRCPMCGMKLLAATSVPEPSAGHDHAGMDHEAMDHAGMDHGAMDREAMDHGGMDHGAMGHGGADGIEWEDDMVEVNRLTTTATMHWKFLDRTTGADSSAINWQFTVGQRVKIRLVNEMDSDHPMHHPFHLHGAGRFLVLARDGVTEPNLVWKDTVLVRTGQVVDILFDVTNPGLWMAHCHIAEHMQSGMMFSFNVTRNREAAR
jgi:FtsP/CotA-like multicopper oxidase with cupredoxin domain